MNPLTNPASDLAANGADSTGAASTPAFSPLYQQIKGLVLQSLQAGEWKPGDTIPSEFELAARYKVSQGTVRKAIDELAKDHLLVRRQGKGTFVATHAEQQLLPNANAPIAPVQPRCESAVFGTIAFDVGIEQEQAAAADIDLPDAGRNRAAASVD